MRKWLRTVNGGLIDYLLFVLIMVVLFDCGAAAAETVAPVVPVDIDWRTLVIVAFLAAPAAMVVTQLGKRAIKRYASTGADPFWYQWGLRLLACVVGAAVGAALLWEALPWGTMAGAAGGALSSVIVATLRKMVRNVARSQGPPPIPVAAEPEPEDDDGPEGNPT